MTKPLSQQLGSPGKDASLGQQAAAAGTSQTSSPFVERESATHRAYRLYQAVGADDRTHLQPCLELRKSLAQAAPQVELGARAESPLAPWQTPPSNPPSSESRPRLVNKSQPCDSAPQTRPHLTPLAHHGLSVLIRVPLNDMPLNDDGAEKAKNAHSRRALQEAHVNNLKAATGTPLRKTSVNLNDLEADSPASPPQRQKTPRPRPRDMLADDDDVVVSGTAVTPMKRVPILANFEEWMKMATDNKINATNSWNFALIDYFHDMSLLKEGDGVNFQKASCTLDGCVKIYTSRVDSVATETGKLLSGLADSRDSKKKREGEEGEGEESEEEVDEDGNVRKKAKRKVCEAS